MQISWQEVVEYTQRSKSLRMEYWFTETLFSFSWWILLVTTIGHCIVWFVILDRKRIFEILTYGFLVSVVATILDALGVLVSLWDYKHTLTPLILPIEIHIVIMPIIYMIIYQYFHTWKNFIIASTINALLFSFVLEPLLVWLQVYELNQWKHFYSFFPYIIMGVLFKYLIVKIKQT
ncbi:CBO0543 family protein [Paucisalibacillus globulus]|uniref:CBO0543 family protein n=1 Tax=Paucisalibacillus globulus TaxID=351095 RepID=UPI000407CFC0|nr:CBO0543 family protein [Paucisalibacillus globulus]